jgi:hypothetical protein
LRGIIGYYLGVLLGCVTKIEARVSNLREVATRSILSCFLQLRGLVRAVRGVWVGGEGGGREGGGWAGGEGHHLRLAELAQRRMHGRVETRSRRYQRFGKRRGLRLQW